MDGKKISFGFMKTKKVDKPVVEEKKEFIESIEEKSIKVVGGEEIKEITPLVIPMKPNTLITAERLKEIALKVESALDEPEPSDKPPKDKPQENETLDQMAVRELLENAKKEVKVETPQLTVPLPGKSITDGEKESTLDDYESVPIQDFGLAMLRGMGWTQNNEKSKYKPPTLRPKGLGLGADKVVKDNQKKNQNQKDKDEELSIVKNAYVKITSGKHSGYYGKVVSLDEDNGRVMVDIAVKKETISLSEFMMLPVTKAEYDKESKVINANTYEEYKKNENTSQSLKSDRDKSNKSTNDNKYSESSKNRDYTEKESSSRNYRSPDRKERDTREKERETREKERETREKERETREKDRDRSNRERNRDSNDERYKKKKPSKRYSSNESLDSLSDTEKKHKKKNQKRYSSSESLSSEERYKNRKVEKKYSSDKSDHRSKKEKRDIDKKRKGKKKKRDRDRSPNYRKHRK